MSRPSTTGIYTLSRADALPIWKASRFVTRQRPDAHFTEFTAVGPVEKVAEYVQSYIEAGGSKFVLRPMCSADETMEQLEILGEELLPMFPLKK